MTLPEPESEPIVSETPEGNFTTNGGGFDIIEAAHTFTYASNLTHAGPLVKSVPGPLFTFAAYLGTVMTGEPNGITGGLICLIAVFASSFLLVIGAMPFWDALRRVGAVQNALLGVNAAVVGLLLAALYDPVWTSAILSASDFGLALAAFTLLVFWKTPPWLGVILTALGGWVLHAGLMS